MKSYFTMIILITMLLSFMHTSSLAQPGIIQDWQKYANNPVFNSVEGPGSIWNKMAKQLAMNVGHVMWDGSEYRFYMGGYDGDNFSIGLATSTSLDSGWTWYSGNPVLTPGSPGKWDDYDVGSPVVIKDGDTLKMWYLGSPDANVNWKIGYATALDGINWTKHDDPVLEYVPGTWEGLSLSSMYVIRDRDSLKMWYVGEGIGTNGIGYAVSVDGIKWEKSNMNPVLKPGQSGKFDAGFVTMPSVRFENGIYRMWYMATPDLIGSPPWQTGFAFSYDGVEWTKDENNPVLSVGEPGQWDEDFAVPGDIFKTNDSTYSMLYYGSNLQEYHLGLATWDLPTSIETDLSKILSSFTLHQNYPNPLNPTTNIEFSIAKSELVTLKISNILGEEVATLVSEKLPAGKYKYDWNASGLASGVYLYRIQAGDYVAARKMVLLR
jgi:hypothetical protein